MVELDVVGRSELVMIHSEKNDQEVIARIDSGAAISSIDVSLAAKLQVGPIIESIKIRSSNGSSIRPVVKIKVTIQGRKIRGRFTVIDRSHMKYPLLIGRNILQKKFIIDPSRQVG